jgi:spore coat protein CotH
VEEIMRRRATRLLVRSLLASVVLTFAAGARAQDDPSLADRFFDDSAVREIRLTLNSKDWAALKQNFTENTYYPTTLMWENITVRNVGIRSRGLGSRSGTKPGLRVDCDRYQAAQLCFGLKSFVLDNAVQDPSMIRERVAMQLFRRMGLPAPREAHVKLYVNDAFAGLYVAVESIDKVFLARTFGADSHGGVENDGYLFEYDWHEAYYFEYRGDDLESYKMFDPKTNENKAAAQIWGPVRDMIKIVNQTNDALFERDVSAFLDLSLFVRHIALENFIAEWDGILGYAGMNNFYLYRFEDTTRSQFLAWDKDNTFAAVDHPVLQGVSENVLARRTLAQPRYMNAYLDTLLEAAASAAEPDPEAEVVRDENGNAVPSPGWLEREIQRQYTQIRTHARSDTMKPANNDEFEAAIRQLLEFARQRSAFVRGEVHARRGR